MDAECHALLKGVCALKGITLSAYVYKLLNENFRRLVREDKQVQTMFLAGTYTEGGDAYILKQSLIEDINSTNDSSA